MGTNKPRREVLKPRNPLLQALFFLDACALGWLAAMIVVNRLLVAQFEVYKEVNFDAASTILDFMDDVFPWLLFAIVLVLALGLLTGGVWLLQRSLPLWVQAALVGAGLLFLVLFFTLGRLRRSETPAIPPVTPTPTVSESGQ